VVWLTPSATSVLGEAMTLDRVLLGAPAIKSANVLTVTAGVALPKVATKSLLSATVLVSEVRHWPLVSLLPLRLGQALPLPPTVRVTVWPGTGLPKASFVCTTMLTLLWPLATVCAALSPMELALALGAPGVKVNGTFNVTSPNVVVRVSD
jgi:hypothetical protein